MENRNNVLLTVIGVATLLVVLVGASFAYFTATASTTADQVETGKLEITSALTGTSENRIKPTDFTVGEDNVDVAEFTFTVTGGATNVDGATYDIRLLGLLTGVAETADKGSADDIKYALYDSTNTPVATGSFADVTAETIIATNKPLSGSTNDVYTLYVYIEESHGNQDNLQNVTINATMHAVAKTPAPAGA
ncbi:MAG: hypothetical protein IJO32_07590 [Bacilli bacterium]|nr:hypothetical protein [Bacilli bacterium]